jgi:sugar O-acyltransferase (sialic acid O-acetyltransferase NeuD family)
LNNVIIGYSGHAFVVIEAVLANGRSMVGYCERSEKIFNPFKLKYLGIEAEHADFFKTYQNINFFLGIGDNLIRRKVAERLSGIATFAPIFHPRATISNSAKLGKGCFVSSNAVISSFVEIDDYCIIKTNATVEHESKIGKAVHIAPGAVLCGNVTVGENTLIGANSVVIPGIQIGKNVIIGAGSVVIRDVPNNVTLVGNPSKIIKK